MWYVMSDEQRKKKCDEASKSTKSCHCCIHKQTDERKGTKHNAKKENSKTVKTVSKNRSNNVKNLSEQSTEFRQSSVNT